MREIGLDPVPSQVGFGVAALDAEVMRLERRTELGLSLAANPAASRLVAWDRQGRLDLLVQVLLRMLEQRRGRARLMAADQYVNRQRVLQFMHFCDVCHGRKKAALEGG